MALKGRPPTGEKTKRDVIAVRATAQFRDQIDAAAAAAGRSMSQEIEARLRDSFTWDEIAGSPATVALVRRLASSIFYAEKEIGGSWKESFTAYDFIRRHAIKALELHLRSEMPHSPDEAAIREAIRSKQTLQSELASIDAQLAALGQGPSENTPSGSADYAIGWMPRLDALSNIERQNALTLFEKQYDLIAKCTHADDQARATLKLAIDKSVKAGEPIPEGIVDLSRAISSLRYR